ncbi:MAG: GNAT family N-acetyltransferase [Gemmatimonadetes bacterium]|nr:GNAT family N-acetyltransferase [Gemmatimonadota bacterium]
MGIEVRVMTEADWPTVAAIYKEGIETGHATFETTVPTWERWDEAHADSCRLVAELDDHVVGWAALSAVTDRCVYGGVGEVSVYVGSTGRGKGVGTLLLSALVEASEKAGFWSLQAGMFPENAGSIALHSRCGFRQVGTRERLGKMEAGPMKGKWRDVLLFERRSPTVGV